MTIYEAFVSLQTNKQKKKTSHSTVALHLNRMSSRIFGLCGLLWGWNLFLLHFHKDWQSSNKVSRGKTEEYNLPIPSFQTSMFCKNTPGLLLSPHKAVASITILQSTCLPLHLLQSLSLYLLFTLFETWRLYSRHYLRYGCLRVFCRG